MGTYTTNYNLYMPTVGETGWGILINGNYQTIDSTMKGLSNRITAVESEVNGTLSCTSVTASGKITGNGGIAGTTGTFSGAVSGTSFNGVVLKSSGTITVTPTNTSQICITSNDNGFLMTILPYNPGTTYTGSITFYNTTSNASRNVYYNIGDMGGGSNVNYCYYVNIAKLSNTTITFNNIPYLSAAGEISSSLKFGSFKLS